MIEIKTEITIDSPPEKVWKTLTNFEHLPTWNPFIREFSGKLKEGENITVKLQLPNGKGMTFKPILLAAKENKELRWLGKLGIKGVFDGEHYFLLNKTSDGKTNFIHGEKFGGILPRFMKSTLEDTKKGFNQMNQALKSECETD